MTATRDMRAEAESDAELAASFPADFLWGAATAAYQIEGATREDMRGPSIWDQFSHTPGKTRDGDTGDIAADHYHRMKQDVRMMADLGLTGYRFSIAWPRILPDGKGAINLQGLDFYDRLVDNLLQCGITPVATLYHWDLPQALEDNGGWRNRDTALAFADYAEVVARRLGDRIAQWITLNEPWCSAYLGYGIGVHAPGMRSMQAAINSAHHLLLAHGLAVPRLRRFARPGARVGITLNLTPIYAADRRPETLRAQQRLDKFHNRWFLDPIYRGTYPEGLFESLGGIPPTIADGDFTDIVAPIDFLGINYYSRLLIQGDDAQSQASGNATYFGAQTIGPIPGSEYTEMGWEVYPEGLADILLRVHRDYKPQAIAVTENGAAYRDIWEGGEHVHDDQRVSYLREHIQALAVARMLGVPVGGYYAWSLMDNFEWAEGYSRRFGLTYVDYLSQRRIVKDSGRWYAQLVAAHLARKKPNGNGSAVRPE